MPKGKKAIQSSHVDYITFSSMYPIMSPSPSTDYYALLRKIIGQESISARTEIKGSR